MPLASSYSYPLLGAFWTILEIFLWVLWIWVLIYVFIDIFRHVPATTAIVTLYRLRRLARRG